MTSNIRIVDDEEHPLCLHNEELIDEGYRAVVAKDGVKCLEKIKAEDPDIVLIVDDEERLLCLYKEKLMDAVVTKDGAECREKIKTEDPNIVVLDIRMSKMDGKEVINRITGLERNCV